MLLLNDNVTVFGKLQPDLTFYKGNGEYMKGKSTVALEVAPSDNYEIHVTISDTHVPCRVIYNISISMMISIEVLILIETSAQLVKMASVNALRSGSSIHCAIHRTDPALIVRTVYRNI